MHDLIASINNMVDMKTISKASREEKKNFFVQVLNDKRAMREYIKLNGSLVGFKPNNYSFVKPL